MGANIVLNELSEAKRLLTFPREKIREQSLFILAKYYREHEGMKPSQVRKKIIEYCKHYDPTWDASYNDSYLKKILNKAKRYCLRIPHPIYIREQELEKIASVNNMDLEKFLFVLLVYAKIMKFNPTKIKQSTKPNLMSSYFVGEKETRLFSIAGVQMRKDTRRRELNKLFNLGLIDRTERGKFVVRYAEENSPVVLIIEDYESIVLYYLRWKGYKIGGCSCGKLFYKRSIRQVECSSCYRERIKKQDRERKRMSRLYNVD